MTKLTFLSGVGIAALSGALAAVPATASTGETATVIADEFAATATTEENADEPEPSEAGSLTALAAPDFSAAPFIASASDLDTFVGLRSAPEVGELVGPIRFDDATRSGLIANVVDADPRIIARDDLGIDGIVDTENEWPSVVHMFRQNNQTGGVFFNCTGTVINPRTILTAAHCLYQSSTTSSEDYGLPESGANQAILIASGVDSSDRLFNGIFDGLSYSEGGTATSTDVIIHPSANVDTEGNLLFPWADVALIAVDQPITDVPALPILLSPLGELTHVVALGYGTNGTGLEGAVNTGSPFLRRVGENMLGLIGTQADFIDQVFPSFAPSLGTINQNTQTLYWFDFDNPDRTDQEKENCVFSGTNINCTDLNAVRAIDFFDGDALDREVATAPGDSGSPLIVDELYDFPVVTAVLSGGYDFFGTNNTYGDVSFYNPLFPFFEFITENTPYKYVSAIEGDGNWSDPTHWTQELDPGFFIDDGNGNLVNGIPAGEELGVYTTGPKIGTVLGVDISEGPVDISPNLPPFGTPGFGPFIPESSELLGPGSTGFVPQNTDGTPGTAFENPAQYFEVMLTRAGTTTVDLDVTIDRLVIDNAEAGFVLPDQWTFDSLINVEQLAGSAQIDGSLNTPIYILGQGVLEGTGTIDTDVLFNVAGVVSAGRVGEIGTFAIDGDYVQTSAGILLSEFEAGRRGAINTDVLDVSGIAVLDGDLVLATESSRVRFGTEFTVLDAVAIDGDFATTTLVSRSPILTAEHRIEDGDVIVSIEARSIRDVVRGGRGRSGLDGLATTLDTIRRGDSFAQFADMFALVDNASIETLGATLASLTPTSAFSQSFTANSFAQRFTGQIAQRTLSLRGGSRAVGAFSAAGNASFAIAGDAPAETGQLAVFGSASGVYRGGQQLSGVLGPQALGFASGATANSIGGGAIGNGVIGNGGSGSGANALEQATLTQAGELTIGADLRVSDAFSVGLAISDIRNASGSSAGFAPRDNRSQSVAIYATYADGPAFVDGYAGTSSQDFGLDRSSQGELRNAFANALGEADGRQVFGGVRVGYAFDLASSLEVGPVASLDYVRNDIGGYDEWGAGAFGLLVDDRSFTSLGAKVGAMASYDIRSGKTNAVRAFGSLAYARELADTADVVTARFAGAEDLPFSIANALDPQWVSLNAGAEMALGTNLQATVSVTSDMGRGVLSNDQGQVSLSWQF